MENGSSEPLDESTENKYKNQTINGILKWVRNVFKGQKALENAYSTINTFSQTHYFNHTILLTKTHKYVTKTIIFHKNHNKH